MSTFSILILVCSMSLDHAACQPDTAIDVVQGPKVQNELMCGLFGQTTIAATAVAPRAGEEYVKIVCRRASEARRTAEVSTE